MLKKRILFLCTFILIPVVTLAQLDIDQLKTEIIDFTLVDSTLDLHDINTKTFVSNDSTIVYEINYDLNGEIVNGWGSWGVAISKSTLDKQGRVIEYFECDPDGVIVGLDAPEITQTVYLDSISVVRYDYFHADRTFNFRSESTFDDKGREIEDRTYDHKLNLIDRTSYEFNDKKKTCIVKSFNTDSELQITKCGAAIFVYTHSHPKVFMK